MDTRTMKNVGYAAGGALAAYFFPVTAVVVTLGIAGVVVAPIAIKAWRETH